MTDESGIVLDTPVAKIPIAALENSIWNPPDDAKTWLSRGFDTISARFCFKPLSASEILSHSEKAMNWVWEQYIAVGDLVLFTAYMKVGKSTLIYPLVLAVARGQAFLNRKTLHGGVLVLALEEHLRDVKLRLEKLGMTKSDPVYVHAGAFPATLEALAQLEAFISENKIVLVVLDSLSAYWDISDENSNAEAVRKVRPLLDLARRTNAAFLLIHHERKGGKEQQSTGPTDGKAIRGASALFGLVDQALSLGRAAGGATARRILRAIGRRSESPKELVIELWGNTQLSEPKPYGYNVIGTPDELDKAANQTKVAKVLSNQPKPLEDIKTESGVKTGAREALESLVEAGHALREGAGVKGDPHKWRLKPCAQEADS